MYRVYALEVHTKDGWKPVGGFEASSRPHHYDTLRKEFESLVAQAKPFIPHLVEEFGYRISADNQDCDVWMAHISGDKEQGNENETVL